MANTPKSLGLGSDLHSYLVAHGTPPDPVLSRLITDTEAMGEIARMQISPEQGALLTMLAKILGAHLIVEVGTFTGYSSVCLARGLADGGRLICCDISAEYTARAVQAWKEAALDDRVDLRIAPAADTLRICSSSRGSHGTDSKFSGVSSARPCRRSHRRRCFPRTTRSA